MESSVDESVKNFKCVDTWEIWRKLRRGSVYGERGIPGGRKRVPADAQSAIVSDGQAGPAAILTRD